MTFREFKNYLQNIWDRNYPVICVLSGTILISIILGYVIAKTIVEPLLALIIYIIMT